MIFDPINYNHSSYCIPLKLSQINKQSSIEIAIWSNLCSLFSETPIEEELRKNGRGRTRRRWGHPRLVLRSEPPPACAAGHWPAAVLLTVAPLQACCGAVASPRPREMRHRPTGLRLRSAGRRTAGAAPAARVGCAGTVLVRPSSLQEAIGCWIGGLVAVGLCC
jgi:hypothetical protein